MAEEPTRLRLGPLRFLLTGACLVILVAGIKASRPLMVPLVVAVFLAALTAPAVFWLKERRIPPVVSIPLIVLGLLVVMTGVGGFLGTSINRFIASAPRYQQGLDNLVGGAVDWLRSHDYTLSAEELRNAVQPGPAMGFVGGMLSEVASMLSDTVLMLLTTVFVLFEATQLPAKLRRAMNDPEADLSRYQKVVIEVKHYVVIKTYVSVGTGVAIALFLWVLDVDFPFLWGLFAFLFNYVPNIGSIIAAIPPILLALVQFGPGRALVVAGGFVAVNMVVGNMIEPELMGRSLGLSTLVVFLSLVFWGWVWGPVGMLLSVPLTMVLKIALEHVPDWRWLAILMGSPEPARPEKPSDLSISRP